PVQVIAANEQAMAEAATRRLLDQGHERIAFVCEVLPRGLSHARWLAGYRLVHVERGLPLDPQLTFITGVEEQGEDRAAAFYASVAYPPTAYIVPDARIAATVLAEMDRPGKPVAPTSVVIHAVPQAAGVYRLDDCPMCYADPDKVERL